MAIVGVANRQNQLLIMLLSSISFLRLWADLHCLNQKLTVIPTTLLSLMETMAIDKLASLSTAHVPTRTRWVKGKYKRAAESAPRWCLCAGYWGTHLPMEKH